MKTFSLKTAEIKKNWVLIDAENLVLGRLASQIAIILRGKNKPEYTPHMDCGDYVVVINAEKIGMKGNSKLQELFQWHTGFMGGLKSITREKIMSGKFPERVLMKAVQRMLPKESPLARAQLTHLRVFVGPEHTHQAQNPKPLDVGSWNRKNRKSA